MPGRIYGFGRSDFETNLPNLVRSDAHGAPAADEARQGYRAASVESAFWPRFEVDRGYRDGRQTPFRLTASNRATGGFSGGVTVTELRAELERRSEASIDRLAAVGIPGLQPVFYFDGSFRTWAEVKAMAGLNYAIGAQIPSYRLTPAA